MSRIRSIHPKLFTDEAFMTLTPMARVFFLGLWVEADDHGIFEWKPLTLKMRILPADNVNTVDLLAETEAVGNVRKFEVSGKPYGAVKNFCKWQRPKAPQYLYPLPDDIAAYVGFAVPVAEEDGGPAERGTALGKMLHGAQNGLCFYCASEITFYRKKPNSLEIDHKEPISRGGKDEIDNLVAACKPCNSLKANMTEQEFRSKFSKAELQDRFLSRGAKASSQTPKIVSGEPTALMKDGEGGKEEEEKKDAPEALDFLEEFNAFWEIYPSKKDRGFAFDAFVVARQRGVSAEDLIAGAERYRDDPARVPKFTHKAHNWLTGQCWLDRPTEAAPSAKPETAAEREMKLLKDYARIIVEQKRSPGLQFSNVHKLKLLGLGWVTQEQFNEAGCAA